MTFLRGLLPHAIQWRVFQAQSLVAGLAPFWR